MYAVLGGGGGSTLWAVCFLVGGVGLGGFIIVQEELENASCVRVVALATQLIFLDLTNLIRWSESQFTGQLYLPAVDIFMGMNRNLKADAGSRGMGERGKTPGRIPVVWVCHLVLVEPQFASTRKKKLCVITRLLGTDCDLSNR